MASASRLGSVFTGDPSIRAPAHSVQLICQPLSGDNEAPLPLSPRYLCGFLFFFFFFLGACACLCARRGEGIFLNLLPSLLFSPTPSSHPLHNTSPSPLHPPFGAAATCLSRPLSAGRLMAVISKQPPAKVACKLRQNRRAAKQHTHKHTHVHEA